MADPRVVKPPAVSEHEALATALPAPPLFSAHVLSVPCEENSPFHRWLLDPYRLRSKPCKSKGHKPINCATNPRCLLGFRDKGIWNDREVAALCAGPKLRNPLTTHAGIKNMGATCYAAAIMHVLYMHVPLREKIFEWNASVVEAPADDALDMACLGSFFAHLGANLGKSVDITGVISRFQLDPMYQQDANEFMKMVLMTLERIFNSCGSLPDDMRCCIARLFQGRLQYCTRCEGCGATSLRTAPFWDIEAPLRSSSCSSSSSSSGGGAGGPSVEQCIAATFAEEHLSGDNQYECSSCDRKCDAVRTMRIAQAPPTLNVQLMRFVFDPATMGRKKVKDAVRLPDMLELTVGDTQHLYELSALVNHVGESAGHGHYVAYVWDSDRQCWWHVDDAEAVKLTSNATLGSTEVEQLPKDILSQLNEHLLPLAPAQATVIEVEVRAPASAERATTKSAVRKPFQPPRRSGKTASRVKPATSVAASPDSTTSGATASAAAQQGAVTGFYVDPASHAGQARLLCGPSSICRDAYVAVYTLVEPARAEAWRKDARLIPSAVPAGALYRTVTCDALPAAPPTPPTAYRLPTKLRDEIFVTNATLVEESAAAAERAAHVQKRIAARKQLVSELVSSQSDFSWVPHFPCTPRTPDSSMPTAAAILDASVAVPVMSPTPLDFVFVPSEWWMAWASGADVLSPSSIPHPAAPTGSAVASWTGTANAGAHPIITTLCWRPLAAIAFKALRLEDIRKIAIEGDTMHCPPFAACMGSLSGEFPAAAQMIRQFYLCWSSAPQLLQALGAPSGPLVHVDTVTQVWVNKEWLSELKKWLQGQKAVMDGLIAGKGCDEMGSLPPTGHAAGVLCGHSAAGGPLLLEPSKMHRKCISAIAWDKLVSLYPLVADTPPIPADGPAAAKACPTCSEADASAKAESKTQGNACKRILSVASLKKFWHPDRAKTRVPSYKAEHVASIFGAFPAGVYCLIPHNFWQQLRTSLLEGVSPTADRGTYEAVAGELLCHQLGGAARSAIPLEALSLAETVTPSMLAWNARDTGVCHRLDLDVFCASVADQLRKGTATAELLALWAEFELGLRLISNPRRVHFGETEAALSITADYSHLEICTQAEHAALEAIFPNLTNVSCPSLHISHAPHNDEAAVISSTTAAASGPLNLRSVSTVHALFDAIASSFGGEILLVCNPRVVDHIALSWWFTPPLCVVCTTMRARAADLANRTAEKWTVRLIQRPDDKPAAEGFLSGRKRPRRGKAVAPLTLTIKPADKVYQLCLLIFQLTDVMPTAIWRGEERLPPSSSLMSCCVCNGDVLQWSAEGRGEGRGDDWLAAEEGQERGFKGSRLG